MWIRTRFSIDSQKEMVVITVILTESPPKKCFFVSINHNFVPYILWVVVVSFDTHQT